MKEYYVLFNNTIYVRGPVYIPVRFGGVVNYDKLPSARWLTDGWLTPVYLPGLSGPGSAGWGNWSTPADAPAWVRDGDTAVQQGTVLTDAEVAAAAALAIAAEYQAAAGAMLSGTDAGQIIEAAVDFYQYVRGLAARGVVLPDPITFQGIRAAIVNRWPDVAGDPELTAANKIERGDVADEMWVRWDVVCYHFDGNLKRADKTFPYLMAAIAGDGGQ